MSQDNFVFISAGHMHDIELAVLLFVIFAFHGFTVKKVISVNCTVTFHVGITAIFSYTAHPY